MRETRCFWQVTGNKESIIDTFASLLYSSIVALFWRTFSSAEACLFSHSYKPPLAATCSNELRAPGHVPRTLQSNMGHVFPYSTRKVTVATRGMSSKSRSVLVDMWLHRQTGAAALGWCTIEMFFVFIFLAKQDQNPLQFIYFCVYTRSISSLRRMFSSFEKSRQIINWNMVLK